METAERRTEIIKILCRRRYEKIDNLAFELGVSERTVRRDIDVLSLSYPIYTQSGRYGGGIYIVGDFVKDRMYMKESEIKVLKKIEKYLLSQNTNSYSHKNKYKTTNNKHFLSLDELKALHSIISYYSKPK